MKKMNTNNNRNCKPRRRNTKRTMRQVLCFALIMTLFCSLHLTIFAAEPAGTGLVPVNASSDIRPMSVYGYAAYYTDSDTDYFHVDAPGSSALVGHATIKSWDFNSSTYIYVNIIRPDGTTAKSDVKLVGNTEVTVSFSKSLPGTYTIDYHIPGTDQGWLGVWVF